MNLTYLVKIDGQILKKVTSCSPSIQDLDSDKSGRIAASGKMVRYCIDRIPSLQIEIGPTTHEELAPILKSLAKKSFEVEWFVPELGAYKTQLFYAGERTPSILQMNPLIYNAMGFELIPYEGMGE